MVRVVVLVVACGVAFGATLFVAPEAGAQAILRDAETELFLQEISAPLYKASRIQADRVQLYVEDSDAINAFADGFALDCPVGGADGDSDRPD